MCSSGVAVAQPTLRSTVARAGVFVDVLTLEAPLEVPWGRQAAVREEA